MGKRGPQKREPIKRISGTGYTYAESLQLKYCRKASDGSYEIDTDKIAEIIDEYTDEERREYTIKSYRNKGKANEEIIETLALKPVSRAGLRKALGTYNTETYALWLDGYVNRDHRDNELFAANIKLSEAVRAGDTEVAVWLCEEEDSKHSSRTIRLLEGMGEIGPAQSKVDVNGNINLGKWGKWGK